MGRCPLLRSPHFLVLFGEFYNMLCVNPKPPETITTVETELKVTQSALDVHMGCTPFVKD